MAQTLILVESVTKARKIQGYLGPQYRVQASIGHICDLPRKSYGVDLDSFEEEYEVQKQDLVSKLRGMVRSADLVLLATDPDREGEAIAWHLRRELKLGPGNSQRIEFREITKSAVQKALESPRAIDEGRVDAQRVRRVLDRIVGFDVSKEICWPAGAQSAGRVQTPALHILCERERKIVGFVPETYWTLGAEYAQGFKAFVPDMESLGDSSGEDGGDDEGWRKGRAVPRKFPSHAEAEKVRAEAARHPHRVGEVNTKRSPKRPFPAYTTSTLQQDASRKLGLSAGKTMNLAQTLFEHGLITYHRTDSARLSDQAIELARAHIDKVCPEALPEKPPTQRVKAGAQDAHEAIRPTGLEDEGKLPEGTEALYALIKARFLASQCKPALFDRTRAWIDSGPVKWLAEGSVLVEQGFLYFWGPYARQSDDDLPRLEEGQAASVSDYQIEEKQTSPPSRYDTGSLVRKLETSGVGRPATFASIIETLLRRQYVAEVKIGRKSVLQPTAFGLVVDGLLSESFPDLVSEKYTSTMESALDRIESGGGLTRLDFLRRWHGHFRGQMESALVRAAAYRKEHGLKARGGPSHGEETSIPCDRCGQENYRKISRKSGRGSFLACKACEFTRDVRAKTKPEGCPECGSNLVERGRKGNRFLGCVRYGMDERPCIYTEPLEGRKSSGWSRKGTEKTCPKCEKAKLVLLTPPAEKGQAAFYACDDRSCGFMMPADARRHPEPCPDCGGAVVERRKKPTAAQKKAGQPGDSFWGCAKFPACRHAADYDGAG